MQKNKLPLSILAIVVLSLCFALAKIQYKSAHEITETNDSSEQNAVSLEALANNDDISKVTEIVTGVIETTSMVVSTKKQKTEKDNTSTQKTSNAVIPTTAGTILTAETIEQKQIPNHTSNEIDLEVYELVNSYREENGLPGYEWDKKLSDLAFLRSKELVSSFSHSRPGGEFFSSLLDEYSYVRVQSSENLFRQVGGSVNAELILNSFQNSSSHNSAMLSQKYTKCGYAYYYENNTHYFVQFFVR